MKFKKACVFLLSTLILVLFPSLIKVNAVNTGFQTQEISIDRKNSFLSSINISAISDEPPKEDFTCFDVNSNHLIAVGLKTSIPYSKEVICIYSNEGVFQYGYTFDFYHGTYEVEWDEENLNIHFIRSGLLVSITPSGEVLDVLEVPVTVENSEYSHKVLGSFKRTVDDTEYSIKNDMGILRICSLSSFSKIIVKDSNGNESIIYDVNSMLFKKSIIIISLVGTFISIALVATIIDYNKRKRNN